MLQQESKSYPSTLMDSLIINLYFLIDDFLEKISAPNAENLKFQVA
jgi:hypothetical protein